MKDLSVKLLRSYLTNRVQYVVVDNIKSNHVPLQLGVPQGSILGPLLLIIYVNDLVNATSVFHPIVYADDTTLVASLNTFQGEVNLNDELVSVSNWMKANKLSINKSKTKAMIFHAPQRRVQIPTIKIEDSVIEFVNEFNFLGMMLHRHLNWKAHRDLISKKLSKTVGILHRLKNILPLCALLHIYNSLVLSHLNYGALLWGWQCQNIFILQKKAVRALTNSKYNCHTHGLFIKLNLLKFHDICALCDLKFCHKRFNNALPQYFLDLLLLSREDPHYHETRIASQLRLPLIKHEFAKQSIKYRFIKTLNNMSKMYREKLETHSLDGFKKYVKNTTVASYSTDCIVENCYVCINVHSTSSS